MKDQFGRNIEYLRVSVTDLCNLRCVYCMPEEGVAQVSHSDILTYDEIITICRICAQKGITRIKLTGGEPLVRRGLSRLVGALKEIPEIEQVTLTTNGILLSEQIGELVQSGLDAVNISLDTLDEEQYRRLTRRGELKSALKGLKEALLYPDIQVKINCVALDGRNQEQWIKLAAFAKEAPVDVRFIEMMPIGLGKTFQGSSQKDICGVLEHVYGSPRFLSGKFGNGPAVYAAFPGFQGKIGFISALSHQFCGECNRIRLTSEGFLKPCLQYSAGADLREALRRRTDGKELERLIEQIIYEKPRCHQFTESKVGEGGVTAQEQLEVKHMSSIGG